MPSYDTDHVRSLALVGHGGCGKTSIGEAIALLAGHTDKLGRTGDASSLLDFETEEQKRAASMSAHFVTAELDGYKVHVVDTPGDGSFLHEARGALQGVDAAVVVVSAPDGVEVSTEQVNAFAKAQGLPRAVFLNKMDRDNVDWRAVVGDLPASLDVQPVVLQLPIGSGSQFRGVVDLVYRRALLYENGNGKATEARIPPELESDVERALEVLMDAVASTDDELVEKYLEEGALSEEEIRAGLNKGIENGTIVPVLFGSATANVGVDRILWVARAFPSATERPAIMGWRPDDPNDLVDRKGREDAPFSALCIKTVIDPYAGQISVMRCVSGSAKNDETVRNGRTGHDERLHGLFHLAGKKHVSTESVVAGDIFAVAKLKDTVTGDTLSDPKDPVVLPFNAAPPPMISYTVVPKSRKDVDKLRSALTRLLLEDPGLHQAYDDVTHELVLSGMGAAHVQASVEKMARKYGVDVELGTPSIPYRETVQGSADVRYRHKKQTGGAGQFGEVAIRVSPADRGAGLEFVNSVFGGAIPTSLIPSVEKGVNDRLNLGVLAGFPVVDVRVELYDGKYHPVDSKDIAFQIAGRQAIKEAIMKARPVLLEPLQEVDVVAPAEQVGDIMGDLNSRRGRILNMDTRGRNAVVKALVPLAEMLNYAPDLRSMTGGKGSYTMKLSGYEPVPSHMQDKLVAEIKRHQEEEEA